MDKSCLQKVNIVEPFNDHSAVQYAVHTTGNIKTGDLKTDLGQHKPSFAYLSLEAQQSSLDFTLFNMTAKDGITLEIQEVHSRYDKPFSYRIYADGKEIYYRTYAPCCDGLNHYFLQIQGSFCGTDIHLRIVSDQNRPVRFHRLFAYADALTLAAEDHINQPMLLGLFSPGISGDESEDARRLIECRDAYAPYPVICGYDVFYIRMSKESLHERLDYLLHLSCVTGVAISIDLNSWWSGTPSGMDGLGGNFRDLAYHQVVYDPKNATGFGVYQLTTPNYWKNMPWLTLNNDHYNAARRARLADATGHLKKKLAEYRAAGKSLPTIALFTENEPDYWHYGAWHDSFSSVSGIEPAAVKAAARQGVVLNPAAGMDDTQCAWLWKNLTDYIVGVGEAITSGIGNGITIVEGGTAHLPEDLLDEHCYTHATTGKSNQPYQDESHSIWETHLIDSLRLGYQGGVGESDPRPLEYATCYGRLAGVNKEQLQKSAYSVLPYSYLFGADFQTIFNYKHCQDSLKNAPKPQDYRDKKVPTLSYDDQIFKYSFDRDDCLHANEKLHSFRNIDFASARGSRAVKATDCEPDGCIVMHVHSDAGFPDGVITEWTGIINRGTEDILSAGYSADSLPLTDRLEGRNQYIGSYFTDWSDRIDKNAKDIYFKIIMPSGLHQTEYNAPEINSICAFTVRTPRSCPSGHTGGFAFTFDELRLLHRLSERREDVLRLIKETGADKNDFAELLEHGCYQSIYDLLLKRKSQNLPADYFVVNQGPLGNYPIVVKTDTPVYVTLREAADDHYVLQLLPHNAPTANVCISLSGKPFCAENNDNILTLSPASDGKDSFTFTAECPKHPLPLQFYGRIMKHDADNLFVQSGESKVTFFADSVRIPVNPNCVFFLRHNREDERMVSIDDITPDATVRFLTNGTAVTEVHAETGSIEGTVTAVIEAQITGEIRQPMITIADENRQITAEIGAECAFSFTGATGDTLQTSLIGNLGLKTGQRIFLKYLPAGAPSPIRALLVANCEESGKEKTVN